MSDEIIPKGGAGLQLGLHDVRVAFPLPLDAGVAKLYRPEGIYKISLGIAYANGRDQDDNPALQGMGDIDGHALLNTRLTFGDQKPGWQFELAFATPIGFADAGQTFTGKIANAMQIAEGLTLTPSLETTWASQKHMQTYLGVSQAQAGTSAHSRFTPDAGIKSLRFGAQLGWGINQNWLVHGDFGISQLVHHAADSPIVKNHGSAT
jgi:outer membrane protein